MASFCKPRGTESSRHLFVGNAGPAIGDSEERLRELFGAYGQVVAVIFPEGRSHAFVSFASEDQAAAALEAAQGPLARAVGRRLVVKPAGTKQEKAEKHLPVYCTAEQTGVPGLRLIPEFVSEVEEQALLDQVEDAEWEELARRRVLHYGYVFHYIKRNIDREACLGPLPDFLQGVKARIEELPFVEIALDQATVNEYPAGVGLSAHIDTHSAFTGPIVSLSLAGDAVMELRRGEERRQLLLPRRSLLVMNGEARYAWAHYIPHRKSDAINGQTVPRPRRRVSFTFRKARGFACDCPYPEYCDSQASTLPPTRMAQKLGMADKGTAVSAQAPEMPNGGQTRMEKASGISGPDESVPAVDVEAQLRALEDKHVHEVYDAIAPHFSSTRVAVWPKVREFIESLPPGALLADAGCGNGKYFGVRQDIAVIASDRSKGLVSQARKRIVRPRGVELTVRGAELSTSACSLGADVCIADAMELPLRDGACDAVVCIAVLHHISSRGRRIRMLEELLRVVRPGGRVLVTVWAQEQENPKKLAKWQEIPEPSDNRSGNQTGGVLESTPPQCIADSDGGDYFVPWHLPFHRTEAVAVLDSMTRRSQGEGTNGGTAGGEINHEKGSVMFKRYYHLFRQGELSRLGQKVQGCEVESEFFDCSNWCLIMRRIE